MTTAALAVTPVDELVEAICHPSLEESREKLFAAYANGACFPIHRPTWKVAISTRKGLRLRTTRDDRARIVEILAAFT